MSQALPTKHVVVAISSHGFGHLAQVAPVLNQFALETIQTAQTDPSIRFTLRTKLPASQITQRVRVPFAIDDVADDFGMQMRSALETDLPASLSRYQALHADWSRHVDRAAEQLTEQAADLVFADIPYMTLAGASHAGIASVAMCSLNWADVLLQSVRACPAALSQAGVSSQAFERILQTMRDAYASATVFLQPTPSMPMVGLANARSIGVVGESPPQDCRETLNRWVQRTHLQKNNKQASRKQTANQQIPDAWLVLVSMGGIPTKMQPANWPTHCNGRPVIYLVTAALANQHPHAVVIDGHAPAYQTLIAASDLVLTKPGYGTFVEACAAGTPILCLARTDWPESDALMRWVSDSGHVQIITPEQLPAGEFGAALSLLLDGGRSEPIEMTGAASAAKTIRGLIDPSPRVAVAAPVAFRRE
jgi:UDP:flavonoid glycosyltransferase YjiC (YdhE family)